jgi:hypothetical protein
MTSYKIYKGCSFALHRNNHGLQKIVNGMVPPLQNGFRIAVTAWAASGVDDNGGRLVWRLGKVGVEEAGFLCVHLALHRLPGQQLVKEGLEKDEPTGKGVLFHVLKATDEVGCRVKEKGGRLVMVWLEWGRAREPLQAPRVVDMAVERERKYHKRQGEDVSRSHRNDKPGLK